MTNEEMERILNDRKPIEYAEFIRTGVYGQLLIEAGRHARGPTLNVWVIEEGKPELRVKVYGAVSGNPGWSEVYDWIHIGPWVEDFMIIAKRFEQEATDKKRREAEESRLREAEKAKVDAKILSGYKPAGGES